MKIGFHYGLPYTAREGVQGPPRSGRTGIWGGSVCGWGPPEGRAVTRRSTRKSDEPGNWPQVHTPVPASGWEHGERRRLLPRRGAPTGRLGPRRTPPPGRRAGAGHLPPGRFWSTTTWAGVIFAVQATGVGPLCYRICSCHELPKTRPTSAHTCGTEQLTPVLPAGISPASAGATGLPTVCQPPAAFWMKG